VCTVLSKHTNGYIISKRHVVSLDKCKKIQRLKITQKFDRWEENRCLHQLKKEGFSFSLSHSYSFILQSQRESKRVRTTLFDSTLKNHTKNHHQQQQQQEICNGFKTYCSSTTTTQRCVFSSIIVLILIDFSLFFMIHCDSFWF
jgi:hypothetical protein